MAGESGGGENGRKASDGREVERRASDGGESEGREINGGENSYGYEREITVRYRDVDAMGHVNNAVYATYLEEARRGYTEDVLGLSVLDADAVVASLSIEFERSITLGARVTVGLGVTDIGNSSFRMGYEVRADGEVAATAETAHVVIDPESETSRPIPEEVRERMREFEGSR